VSHERCLGHRYESSFAAQVDDARNRLAADAGKREEKINAIKAMIEAEKQKFVRALNERLEGMIRNIVVTKVKERVKIQVGFGVETHRAPELTPLSKVAELVQPYQKYLQGSKGRTMRSQMFLRNM